MSAITLPKPLHEPVDLQNGDRMSREEFHAAYEHAPEDFKAELIGGIPGLWIDANAALTRNFDQLMKVLNARLATPEHADFVRRLAERKLTLTK